VTVSIRKPDSEKRRAPLWWRVVRGTVRGTATVIRIVYIESRYTYGVTKTRTRAHYKRWQAERNFTAYDIPEFDEVPRKRRRLMRAQYLCFACNRKYRSATGLNKHFKDVHGSEPYRRPAAPSKILGGKVAGKTRARPSTSQPPQPRPHKPATTRNGNPMSSKIALALKVAWGHMREARPYRLSEIRDDMVGIEQALAAIANESINEYRAHLVRNVGFNPITVQRLAKGAEAIAEAGKHFTAVIAAIDEYYAEDIAAAKKRKGGERPSDETLIS
jgi:hypothetical protein